MNKSRKQYRNHKSGAKVRGIPFLLTYEEWMNIWLTSGKYEQRGPQKGQYVMCRKNDIGPYEIGNVYIDTNAHNAQVAWVGKKRNVSEEHRKKLRLANLGKPHPQKRLECPHCQYIGSAGNMKRFHFDNCQKKHSLITSQSKEEI